MTPASPENGRTITIPEDIAKGLEARIRATSFASIDAFVGFVLARLLDAPESAGFTASEEARLRDRLRSLGYID